MKLFKSFQINNSTHRAAVLRLQRGFSSLGMMLTVSIVGLATLATNQSALRAVDRTNGASAGVQLDQINQAVGTYVFNYGQNILANTPITPPVTGAAAVVNNRAPTIAELQALVGLNANITANAQNGGAYVVAIQNTPTGCTGTTCNLQYQVYVNQPFTTGSGGYPGAVVDSAVAASPGTVGVSSPDAPATIRGQNWTFSNPLGTVSGVLMAVGGTGSSIYSQFVRLNDTRDPNLRGGLSVQGNVTNTGAISASNGRIELGAAGDTSYTSMRIAGPDGVSARIEAGAGGRFRIVDNGYTQELLAVDQAGNLRTQGNINATGVINAAGVINANAGKLKIAATAWETWGCSDGNGAVTTDPNGELLSCRGGVWRKATTSSGWYTHAQWYADSTGWIYNGTGKTQYVVASTDDGWRDCGLQGHVNVWGEIAGNAVRYASLQKCHISFMVPDNTYWLVNGQRWASTAYFVTWVYTL